ncbi:MULTISPECIES: sugar ABC transporter ATP-binding protein [unclassified Rhizobium]|uniref:sugar ABC transporter ATP-binding protein n=1 Tax=unclassified Rhizobium TaxID=2613769 RepID=UPI0016083476|nr:MULTISPECIES: sugar ABC transporter ATP-binding protein [unclassified Rhizobium]MBB3320290.1 simple sugar transport system ATP-binding protein [Rhizobium sp. BK181]MCS4096046.1 simple sugar transport system ATP-binding protein [Rhizobium sp. BK176]
MSAIPLLSLKNIKVTFGGVRALKGVSFEVNPGEVHCLAGENGCGKSTLIKVITGVYKPQDGAEFFFDGQPVTAMTPTLAQSLGIQVIWQDLALFPEMTVAENIGFQYAVNGKYGLVDKRKIEDAAERALARLGVTIDPDLPLKELPIAQRQIVAIARALVGEARLVFMDEPTASLTQSETDYLIDIVRNLSASGVAVVFVSHRLAEVLEISDRMTVLRDGALVGVYPVEGMTQSRVTELMTGRNFDNIVIANDHDEDPVVLSVRGLTRAKEFENISFDLRRGETLGITGLLGAGRTELALTIFGMHRPQAGEISIEGERVSFGSNRDAIRAGVAYLSEDRLSLGLNQPQSIADNLVMASLDKLMSGGMISPTKKASVVDHWINALGVKIGTPDDPIRTLSGGNQQRVAIAKWLAIDPKILILDAPTVGVDVGARAGIFEIVHKLAAQGLAIILISDEPPEVYFNADRIIHMVEGKIHATYDPRSVSLAELEASVYA